MSGLSYICGIRDSIDGSAAACLKIPYRGLEVSIAYDNSCGAMVENLRRSEIRVYADEGRGADISDKILTDADGYNVDADMLIRVFKRIDEVLRLKIV